VSNNRCVLTNRNWVIDGNLLQEKLRAGVKGQEQNVCKVLVVNDFLALGYGLLTLNIKEECVVLHNPLPLPAAASAPTGGGTIACIGAGTGLGECFLTAHAVPAAVPATTAAAHAANPRGSSSSGSGASHFEYQCFACEGGHAGESPGMDV